MHGQQDTIGLTILKRSFGINWNYIFFNKQGHHTVRNKDDLDSRIKTKTFKLSFIELFKSPLFRTVW